MELATALREGKPVVMLVGAADETGAFVPNDEMLNKLLLSVDVAQAAATVEEDRVRILGDVQREFGFDKVNTLAKGAVQGAIECMTQPEVLRAALGDGAPLAALRERVALEEALRAAAAGGLMAPLEALLARPEEVAVEAADVSGMTALMLAAQGGHAAAVEALVKHGARVEAATEFGMTALMLAKEKGHTAVVEWLEAHNAQVEAANNGGESA